MFKREDKINIYYHNDNGILTENNRTIDDYQSGLLEIVYTTEEKSKIAVKRELINLASKDLLKIGIMSN